MMGPFALVQDAPAQTWSERTSNTVEHLVDVIFTSGNTAVAVGTITVAADDNVTVSSDGGSSWTGYAPTPGPENLSAVFSSASTIVAVGEDDGGGAVVVVSRDQGGSWSQADNTGVSAGSNMVDGVFTSGSTAVAVGNAGQEVIRSPDRGATWIDAYNAAGDLLAVFSMAPTVVAVGVADGACLIVVSPNWGANWSRVAVGQLPVPVVNQNMNDAIAVDASTAVAVGANGEVLQSVDNGASWSNPYTAAGAPTFNAVASQGNTVVAVGSGGAISRSTDGGASWLARANAAAELFDVLFLSSTTVLAVGASGTITGSVDAGDTWTAQTSGTSEQLNRIAFNDGNYVVVVGQNGTILLSTDQLTVTQPIPFQSKWLLVFLLVGYGLFVLRRRQAQRPA